jgi:hypothetical protein
MYNRALVILTFLLSLAALASAASDVRTTYVVTTTFPLRRATNGVDGTLELRVDERLTESVRQEMWGVGDWPFVLSSDSKLYTEFSALPPGKAKLTITDNKGRLIAERTLKTPLAKLEPWNPSSGVSDAFLVTEDFSIGFGSYNGPATSLVEVSSTAFRDVKALNTETNLEEPFRLMKSLKSDWRIASREKDIEILSVASHPQSDGTFVIDYVRYTLDGTRWLQHTREVSGLWESGESFPDRSKFR